MIYKASYFWGLRLSTWVWIIWLLKNLNEHESVNLPAFWLTSVSSCPLQMRAGEIYLGWPRGWLGPAIALSPSSSHGPLPGLSHNGCLWVRRTLVLRAPGLMSPRKTLESLGTEQNWTGRRHYPWVDCKLCCLVCKAIRSGECNAMLEAGWPLCPSLSGLLVLHGYQHPAFWANILFSLTQKHVPKHIIFVLSVYAKDLDPDDLNVNCSFASSLLFNEVGPVTERSWEHLGCIKWASIM